MALLAFLGFIGIIVAYFYRPVIVSFVLLLIMGCQHFGAIGIITVGVAALVYMVKYNPKPIDDFFSAMDRFLGKEEDIDDYHF